MRQPPPRPTPFPYTTLFRSLDLLRSEICIEQVERANRSERPDRSAQPGAGPFLAAEDVFRPGRDPGQAQEPVGLSRAQPARLLPPGQRARWQVQNANERLLGDLEAGRERLEGRVRESGSGLGDDRLERRLPLPQHAPAAPPLDEPPGRAHSAPPVQLGSYTTAMWHRGQRARPPLIP